MLAPSFLPAISTRGVCALALWLGLQGSVALAAPMHPWLVPPPQMAKSAHFTNLSDGARIETPYLVKFGLTGMGIAPITKAQEKTGHHHLLINRELPMNFAQPLPFNDQYVHFGKGQMETVLTLKPGDYTLRLVLADHRHVPNFVYSKPLKITVTKFNADQSIEALSQPGVSLMLPKSDGGVALPVQVMFHASKLNVSHLALKEKGTGHFRLNIAAEGGRSEQIDFAGGETEAWFKPPRGRYQLKLDFVDNTDPSKVLHSSPVSTLDLSK
ncbi:DUF4399 domain-containing protein [Paucibacter sp. APW11]|uniref:DUF4399 domain-containing protein n=1 Tax=Roseateles aquae TaxID=3077235 RepID=A0ABU3PB34_9BURK|nr:DUF4399 domain-containing protein [Paucibacter sp. APW11]MDT8999789.1 DUF4399 domain-containing protein [Paucibacter sp. APW11]